MWSPAPWSFNFRSFGALADLKKLKWITELCLDGTSMTADAIAELAQTLGLRILEGTDLRQ